MIFNIHLDNDWASDMRLCDALGWVIEMDLSGC